MKNTKKRIKIFPAMLMLIICFLGVSTTKSQVGLRKALDYDGDGKAHPIGELSNHFRSARC